MLGNMSRIISPSVLSADFLHLGRDTEMLNRSEAEWIHIDVMDGVFVPNLSFGFPVLSAIRKVTTKVLDTHLMIVEPERYIERFAKAGADIITIHTPLLPSTTGMINKEAIAKMKDGVVFIDNARGELVDIDAITEAVESGKFSALFMDAFPGETGIIHVPHNEDIIHTPGMPYFKLKYLRSFVNVYHTPHMAFFTEEAAEQMAECGVNSIYEILTDGKSSHEIPC